MALKSRFLPSYTYDDYVHWKGRWEIIDGLAYAMSPMPSPDHQKMASVPNEILRIGIRNSSCQNCEVYQPIDVKISKNTVVNPDLLIIGNDIKGQFLDFPPELVVEILSPSTRLKDLHTKYELYQDFGIKYYLIVDLENKSLMMNERNAEGKYQNIELLAPIHLHEDCTIRLNLENVWI